MLQDYIAVISIPLSVSVKKASTREAFYYHIARLPVRLQIASRTCLHDAVDIITHL